MAPKAVESMHTHLLGRKATVISPSSSTNSSSARRTESIFYTMPTSLFRKISAISKNLNVSTEDFILTSFVLTLRRWKQFTDDDSILMGVEQQINWSGARNSRILCLDVAASAKVAETLPTVRKSLQLADSWKNVSLQLISKLLGLELIPGQNPFYRIGYSYQKFKNHNLTESSLQNCDILLKYYEFDYDPNDASKNTSIEIQYNANIYYKEVIHSFLQDFLRTLKNSGNYCPNISLRGKSEDFPALSISEQIMRQLLLTSDDPSISSMDTVTSGTSLLADIRNTAAFIENEMVVLTGSTVRVDDVIPVLLPSNDAVLPILAVQYAGASYAPIDPSWPTARKDLIVNNVRSTLVMDDDVMEKCQKSKYQRKRWFLKNAEFDLSYVIHTSGSTGVPKGVGLSHKNLTAFINQVIQQTLMRPNHPVYHSINVVFDASIVNIFGSFLSGSPLSLHDDIRRAPDEIQERHCGFVFLTSAMFNALGEDDLQKLSDVERIFMGGETIREKNLFAALRNGAHITNNYGPTEVTVWTLSNKCGMESGVGTIIGCPLSNESCYIDGGLREGELILTGAKVGRGYFNMADDQRFFWSKGAKCYRTGDLGTLQAGRFIYKDRLNGQVKIRGNRIETAEVENAIVSAAQSINTAVVLKIHEQLIAFVVSSEKGVELTLPKLLESRLTSYMLPSAFVQLDSIPLTVGGKVDKEALTKIYDTRKTKEENKRKNLPQTMNSMEVTIAECFATVLQVEHISVDDHFFKLGGHSLTVFPLKQAILEKTGISLEVVDVLQNPLVSQLASLVVSRIQKSESPVDTSIFTRMWVSPKPKFNMYLIHAIGGSTLQYFGFLNIFPKDVSIYGIEFNKDIKADGFKQLAAYYAKAIAAHTRNVQPFLLGQSFGGTLSREVAVDLRMWGIEVPFVLAFDSWNLNSHESDHQRAKDFAENMFGSLPNGREMVDRMLHLSTLLRTYDFAFTDVKMVLFKASNLEGTFFKHNIGIGDNPTEVMCRSLLTNGFDRLSSEPIHTILIDGNHESCLHVKNLMSVKKQILELFKDYL